MVKYSAVRWRSALVGSVLPLLAVSSTHGQCMYEVTLTVGPWCGKIFGYPPTRGTGVSAQGDVVGWYTSCLIGPDRAFLWTAQAGLTTLAIPTGFSEALATDISGSRIVGQIQPAGTHRYLAALWQDDQVVNLGTLPGGNFSQALAVNSSGQVVGRWGNNIMEPLFPRAFLWKDGKMIDLELPLGSRSAANDINEQGQVVGWMGQSFSIDSHAFIWEDGRVTDLGVIPGGFTARPQAINNSGTVVGSGRTPPDPGVPFNQQTRGFVWDRGKMTVLEPFPGHLFSSATHVNDRRQVVGVSWSSVSNPSATAGFIWQNGVMTNLNDLIPPGAGAHINSAWGINNAGQIAGTAATPDATMAVLLTPVNVRVGDVNGDCRVNVPDLLKLLAAWGACPPFGGCPADINNDGTVDMFDLSMVLDNWG